MGYQEMPDQAKTEIVVIVDRSGSMMDIAQDMRGGFDALIAEQRKLPGTCHVTLVQFDDVVETVYEGKPIADVPPLVLVPRGCTALRRAVGETIDNVGKRLRNMPEAQRPGRVMLVIITDGYENASGEAYPNTQLKQMIMHQTDVYAWQFLYLGANVDAFAEAGAIGINPNYAANYAANTAGTAALFSSINSSISSYRSGNSFTLSDEDRNKMLGK